jgi:hypothetical protein
VIERRVFLAIGGGIAALAAIYWFTSYEHAGTTMLVLATALVALVGWYVGLRPEHEPAAGDVPADGPYLPAASIWPFGIGVASFLLLNGLLLGTWFLVPGALALVASVIGFARQSRRRD